MARATFSQLEAKTECTDEYVYVFIDVVMVTIICLSNHTLLICSCDPHKDLMPSITD